MEVTNAANMTYDIDAGRPQASCKLVPPCRGRHDAQPSPTSAAKPIGKYYFTEEALIHDLAALKRGEVYDRDEFYRRAKAWYKAEIDRLLHLEQVIQEVSAERVLPNRSRRGNCAMLAHFHQ